MGLSRLIYASHATARFDAAEFAKLVNVSSSRNSRRNITGVLVYCDGFFLQLLEGERSVIAERFAHISLDQRHRNIQLLSERDIMGRSFASWDMSLLHETEMMGNEKIKFRKITNLLLSEPDLNVLGESANQMLEEFKNSIERQSSIAGLRRAA